MIKILLPLITIFCEPNDFTKFAEDFTFRKNLMTYDVLLSQDGPLGDVDVFHLLYLRYMINTRLENHNNCYRDSQEIYDFTFGKKFLLDEIRETYPHN